MGIQNREDKILNSLLESRADNEHVIDVPRDHTYTIITNILTFLIGIFIVLLIWQGFAVLYNDYIGNSLIPFTTPLEAFERLFELLSGGNMFGVTIYDHVFASLKRWTMGYVISAVIGILTGLILGYSTRLYPVGIIPVHILQMIPGLAWIPIAMLMFGLGDESAIFIIAMTAMAPIIINVSSGIRKAPPVIMRVANMVGSSKFSIFSNILIPYASLDIINGLRIGLANAWRVLIAAEMVVGVAVGLGYSISQATYVIDYSSAFVCIMVICAIGLFVEKVVFVSIEKYIRRKIGLEEGV
ncbi:ABC transporter permease [Candidatus Methanomassiliicoccus intestinalis]|jgi:nitrate/sulfonate/bicarbonate ABC transporter, permease protein|uniref:ABC-type nitrate/sulfonate/bicarbonate transport system, permease component n=2 Tax=Candidatus Methanomassiliicoccus intestinalis TaxID=1406512 RepID=R9T6Y7_METII|nr:ABC transporter permease subunit [Candidatus Methanomassiliicoccus intestinalis]AGN26682.1 ABC-type nitrate/sulfonate/bicarbonate transport system, permease component [Candidatus Methanomassiliicoccus intestinalis Issoire-Mx1]TQS82522.1 MAG: hypothetical protein A3207_08980 [Candidatus Methanomassiliicoccus intestinalis]TQS82576.1 MAG: hypothetical protein A3206_08690 [Candidatus Methanomassiliicoccus intestinalis]